MSNRSVYVMLALWVACFVGAVATDVHAQRGGPRAQSLTDEEASAVIFSNTYARTRADTMATVYNLSNTLVDQWFANGGGGDAASKRAALEFLKDDINQLASRFVLSHGEIAEMNHVWSARLSQSGQPIVPNDSTVIKDGAPADGRQVITGADVTNIATRGQEWLNWLDVGPGASGNFEPAPTPGGGGIWYWTIIDVSREDTGGRKFSDPVTDSDVSRTEFFINRLQELILDYHDNPLVVPPDGKLQTILKVAVNPRGG